MGKYLDVEEVYDQEAERLTAYMVQEDSVVVGIYGDEDFACRNADWSADELDDVVAVTQVTLKRVHADEVYRPKAKPIADPADALPAELPPPASDLDLEEHRENIRSSDCSERTLR